MKDLRNVGNNNRFKTIEAIVTDPYNTEDQLVVTLPVGEYAITSARLDVIEADSATDATMDIKVAGTVVNDEVPVNTTGFNSGTFTPITIKTGGDITIEAGAKVPAGDGLVRLVMEIVSLDARDGKYIS